MSTPGEVAGFWSYARDDDEAEKGRITRLADLIQTEYALLTGREIRVFVDREDLAWGEEWRRRIDDALVGTAFFIAIITPRYFQREECRRELLTFAGHAASLGVSELLLPVLYVNVPGLSPDADDEALALVAKTQYEDWRELRLEAEDSSAYRVAVHRLAERLAEIDELIAARPVPIPDDGAEPGTSGDDEPGMVDILAASEEALPLLNETTERLGQVMEQIGQLTEEAVADIARRDAAGKGFAGRLGAARRYADSLGDPSQEMLELGTRYASQLVAVDAGILTLIRMAAEGFDDDADRRAACELFGAIRQMADVSRETVQHLQTFSNLVAETAGFSRDLRAPLGRIQDGVRRVLDGQAIIEEWVRRIDEVDIDCSDVTVPPLE